MNNYVFWGAGNYGRMALEYYDKISNENEKIVCFCDVEKKGIIGKYKIKKYNDINWTDKILIIAVYSSKTIADIYILARKLKICKIYLFSGIRFKETGIFIDDFCVDCSNWGDNVMPQAEMHVVDYCNLNCKGCAHFSPIFKKEIPETRQRLEDIIKLKNKFSNIIRFYLMGGEPFLNNDIVTYIEETRKILPNSLLYIVTNGLLIPNVKKEILCKIKQNNYILCISEYAPTNKMINKIENILKEYKISYVVRTYDSKEVFFKPFSLSDNSTYKHCCISDGCVNIWNGKIARCPSLMYIDYFNSYFKTELPNEGIYDLDKITADEILEYMQMKVPLCAHCIRNEIKWERCGNIPTLEDFAVKD